MKVKRFGLKHRVFLMVLFLSFSVPVSASNERGKVTVVNTFPSDNQAFTQGFELSPSNDLVIATGLYGESYIGELDLQTGHVEVYDVLDEALFGEGITFTPDYLWQVTWENEQALKRDIKTYEVVDVVDYDGVGWGLAYDDQADVIWMSNGSNQLLKRNSSTFELLGSVDIYFEGEPLDQLNELEFANGWIYANVWFQDTIYQIDPTTGQVVSHYEFGPIIDALDLTDEQIESMNVLNGIAHIEGDNFYITGKNYPFVLEVTLESQWLVE